MPMGNMIIKVMNMARLAKTWLGGMVWVAMALRKKEKTIMILVNEVTVSMIPGARERTVSKKRISKSTETLLGELCPAARSREREGKVGSFAAKARVGISASMTVPRIMRGDRLIK